MLEVKISIDDGKGKKADITLKEADNLAKLIIIQQVFNLFGVDSDIVDMTNTYKKIGAAYSSFFETVDNIENNSNSKQTIDPAEIQEDFTIAIQESKDELSNTYNSVNDNQPDYFITGIKKGEYGIDRYKLYYICEACGHKGTHYIYPYSATTWCHNCKYEMKVQHAHPTMMERDSKGNFFRAGAYKDWSLDWQL